MKKLLVVAGALTIAIAAVPSFVGQSQAASAKNPYCELGKTQRNLPSWNEHYGCLQPARESFARAPAPTRTAAPKGPKSEFCDLAKAQRNTPSWNDFYHCR